jgi:hypothetical protein
MFKAHYAIGDQVIFRMLKRSAHPGPRAEKIEPEPRGEDYRYEVDKFWVVAEVRGDNQLLLRTRRGKEHVLRDDDPNLRRPNWFERWLYRGRFPNLDGTDSERERSGG